MPLIPAFDSTPVSAAALVGGSATRSVDVRQAPPLETSSGTDVIARALAGPVVRYWLTGVWEPTSTVTYDTHELPLRVGNHEGDEATTVPPATQNPGARAYAAFKDLGRWLMLTDPDIARMVGIKRTTAYAWERDDTTPRPATVRTLMQHHAIVAAVVDRLGEVRGMDWLAAGSPSAVDLLLQGDLAAVDRRVGDLVFTPAAPSPLPGGYTPDDDDDLPPSMIASRRS